MLAAVSAGGVIGALARYAVTAGASGVFPWWTLIVNVSGCLAIGVLMAVVEVRRPHRLVRPFLGTGVLGGYTTFSAYAVESERLLSGHPLVAPVYLVGTALAALVAVRVGMLAAGRLAGPR